MTMYETAADISDEDQAVVDSLVSIGMLSEPPRRTRTFIPADCPKIDVTEDSYGDPYVEETRMEEGTDQGFYYMVYG